MKTRPHTFGPVMNLSLRPKAFKTAPLFSSLVMALAALTACGPQFSTDEISHSLDENSDERMIAIAAAFTQEEIAAANFQFIKDKVFTPHCLKCHASDVQRGDVNLEDYSTAFQLRKEIRSEVEADRMPRRAPPLSPELKELLFSWIDNGAREL